MLTKMKTDYIIRGGIIKRFVPLTIEEGQKLLATEPGPVAVVVSDSRYTVPRVRARTNLKGIKEDELDEFRWVGATCCWKYCWRVVREDPRKVPEDLSELPMSWLAYIGKGPLHTIDGEGSGAVWIYMYGKWVTNATGGGPDAIYAINVRTDFAKEHYPEYVEALNYKDDNIKELKRSTINDGGPAFPVADSHHANGQVQYGHNGMTLRAYAAIKLRVSSSGIDWLDDMITRAKLDEFAGQALAGLAPSEGWMLVNKDTPEEIRRIARNAYDVADAMLAECEKGSGV